MTDLPLIQTRLREVLQAMERHRLLIDELAKEQVELEMAARVIARLTGAARSELGAQDANEPQEAPGGKPEGTPTMPEMIMQTMASPIADFMSGMAPKDVTDAIRKRWWPDVNGANVSAIMWRMWKRGHLNKDEGSAVYSLPQKVEAADDNPSPDQSAASLTPAEGREAGPGGGTS